MKRLLVILLLGLPAAAQVVISGQTTVTGQVNVGSSAPVIVVPQPIIVSPSALPSATVGVPYSFTLQGSSGTLPYDWRVPGTATSGQVDVLDFAAPSTRNTSHLSAPGLYKAFHIDAGLLWWIKNSPGNPWDGELYDGSFIYHWFTEDGDSADQAACIAAGYASCFVNPNANKTFVTPVPLAPRYFTLGGSDVVTNSAGTNPITRTTNCGADNQPQINIGNIVGVLHDAGTMTLGPDGNNNSLTGHVLILNYYYGLSSVTPPYQSGTRERYYLMQGYGQVQWDHAPWNGSTFAVDQTKITATVTTGGAPTPNFACKVPNYPLSGGLPPGTTITSAPQLNLDNIAGTVAGNPSTAGTYNFTAQLEDAAGKFATQQLQLIVLPAASPLSIVQASLPTGTVNVAYPTTTLTATGGSGAGYVFTLNAGTLPQGITFSAGVFSGTPTQSGNFPITIQVTDNGGHTAHSQFTLTINNQVSGAGPDNRYCNSVNLAVNLPADGPVSTPLTHCFYTPIAGTPSPGTVRTTTMANLASTYAAAACGDVIKITAGTTANNVVLSGGKNCDNAHWITIEGSGVVSDANFPAEGTRSSPCFSNVSSLPNRPAYPCGSPATDTAQFVATSSNNGLKLQGLDHIRFIGVEVTRVTTPGALIYSLIDLSSTSTQTNHIIFDRCWIHGVNADGTFPQTSGSDTSTTRGIYLGQSNTIAVIDSYLSDFYDNGATASNGNTDAQAIGGGVGGLANSGWGNYKFVNNHMEGASEGLILGGAGGPPLTPAGCTFGSNCNIDVPTNIEVRRNLFFAPNSWNGNTTTINAVGWPNRKNGIEFKVGANVLLEANVFENCWYSSQPYCYTFDFAPKNSKNGANQPTDPTAMDQDFVARYNYGYNYPGPMIAIYSTQDSGCTTCTTLGRRGSVHDNLVGDKLNKGSVTGLTGYDGIEFLADAGPMTQISIRHNSIVNGWRSFLLVGARVTGYLDQITIQDNIGTYTASSGGAPWFAGNGASSGPCDLTSQTFTQFLNACINGTTATWTVDHNLVFNTANLTGWPSGNLFQTSASGVNFVSYGTGDSSLTPGNYALQNTSPGHNAASDGSDIGANVTQLQNEISGVATY